MRRRFNNRKQVSFQQSFKSCLVTICAECKLTHDSERDGVHDGLPERLVRPVALINDVVLALCHHNVHLGRRHEAALPPPPPHTHATAATTASTAH